jgi:hypothetical protein
MQRFANDVAINRKAKIGTYLTLGGFGLLIVSLVLSFRFETVTYLSLGSALIGVIFTQTGVSLSNKWGRHPRADEIIDGALKGMGSEYALFHYSLGSDHVLFTTSKAFVLIPCLQEGEISYEDGKWWEAKERRGKIRRKEIKRINSDAEMDVRASERKINRLVHDEIDIEIAPLLVFMHPNAKLMAQGSIPPGVHHKKLKSYLRKNKAGSLRMPIVAKVSESLGY